MSDSATTWTAACQASLSITNSRSFFKLMSIELVMPSNHLILCCPLLLLHSIFPSVRVFSNESVLRIRWPKDWSFSFSISPSSSECSGLISFRLDWLNLLAVQGTLSSLLPHHSSKASIIWHSAFFVVQLTSIHDYWKNPVFDQTDLCWQSNVSTLSLSHCAGLCISTPPEAAWWPRFLVLRLFCQQPCSGSMAPLQATPPCFPLNLTVLICLRSFP